MNAQLAKAVDEVAATLTPDELEGPAIPEDVPYEFVEGTPTAASHITLCSIYPEPLEHKMMLHKIVTYAIKAGTKDKPSYLKVYNSFIRTQNTEKRERDDPDTVERMVQCKNIVHDLLMHWGGHHPGVIGTPGQLVEGNRSIGVFQCKGDVATPKELALAHANQTAMFNFVINRENEFWNRGIRNRDHSEARRALDWLGIRDYANYPWYPVYSQAAINKCLACRKDMDSLAHICSECHTNLAVYMRDRGITVDPKMWPGVAQEMKFLVNAKEELNHVGKE